MRWILFYLRDKLTFKVCQLRLGEPSCSGRVGYLFAGLSAKINIFPVKRRSVVRMSGPRMSVGIFIKPATRLLIGVVALLLSASANMQGQVKINASPESPDAVCSYITSKMMHTIPQIPTLCSGKQAGPGRYDISIFSPQRVLEGNMRRGWSIALFQTLQVLAIQNPLKGACSTSVSCILRVSDAYSSINHWYYEIPLNKEFLSFAPFIDDGPASDNWYLGWWNSLHAESEIVGSKGNAEALGKDACESLLHGVSKYLISPADRPVCSIMLATPQKLYIVVDFPNIVDSLNGLVEGVLPTPIGKTLENSIYSGDVVFRSSWLSSNDGDIRTFRLYSIKKLSFLWQEIRSGERSEADAGFLLGNLYTSYGQVSRRHFSFDQGNDLVIRNAAVDKLTPIANAAVMMDLTDGSEWKISLETLAKCRLVAGKSVLVSGVKETGKSSVTTTVNGSACNTDATFVGAW